MLGLVRLTGASTMLASLVALAVACPTFAASAQTSAPSPAASAAAPVCTRVFFGLTYAQVVACTAVFAKQGLGLSALSQDAVGNNDGPYTGAFEPGPVAVLEMPYWPWFADFTDSGKGGWYSTIFSGSYGQTVAVRTPGAPEYTLVSLIGEDDRAHQSTCDPFIRTRYENIVSQQAAKGYAPYDILEYQITGAGVFDKDVVMLVKAPPRDTATAPLCGSKQEVSAFVERARAKGFMPYRICGALSVWRRYSPATNVIEADEISRTMLLARAESMRGEGFRIIDICTAGNPGRNYSILWMRA